MTLHLAAVRLTFLLPLCALGSAAVAYADTVQGTAVVYAAGTQSALAASAGGSLPDAVAVGSGASYFTFSTSGSVTLNNGTYNDADGVGAATSSSSNSGYGSISGIVAPNAGYLTGVFVAAGGPVGAAPASLDFTSTGMGTSFASLNPLLNQVFFIGDGLTGDGTGTTQKFYVPKGAGTLYLGISDAGGYNGGPGSYGDNAGAFNVAINQTGAAAPGVTPEPTSLALLGTGMLSLVGLAKRRRTQAYD